jgi:hypothetical protein
MEKREKTDGKTNNIKKMPGKNTATEHKDRQIIDIHQPTNRRKQVGKDDRLDKKPLNTSNSGDSGRRIPKLGTLKDRTSKDHTSKDRTFKEHTTKDHTLKESTFKERTLKRRSLKARTSNDRTSHKKRSLLPGAVITAFIAAAILFAILLHTEKEMLNDYEKAQILTVSQFIPKGKQLTSDNVNQFLTYVDMDAKLIPESALTLEDVNGLITVAALDQGAIVTKSMFASLSDVTKGMKQPVIAGCRADDLYQMADGILRPGDRVDIYAIDEQEGSAVIRWEDIYVQQVFDATGNALSDTDTTTGAQRMNVYLESEDVEAFYAGLSSGTLRAVKVIDEGIQ